MDNITEDEAEEMAEVIYTALKDRGVIFLPRDKRTIVDIIADSIVEKIEIE